MLSSAREKQGWARLGRDVPRFLREQPSLDEAQLADAASRSALSRQWAGPVDVECCWHAGQLYLLQSRPITTLK